MKYTTMAKMGCKCGNILSTTQAPNDIALHIYTDKEWDAIMDCETIIPWEFPLPKYDVWMCPKCKRLYVFEKGNDTAINRTKTPKNLSYKNLQFMNHKMGEKQYDDKFN